MRAKTGVDLLNNTQDWRIRAKKIRVIGEAIFDGAYRQLLFQIANDMEQMAQLAEDQRAES